MYPPFGDIRNGWRGVELAKREDPLWTWAAGLRYCRNRRPGKPRGNRGQSGLSVLDVLRGRAASQSSDSPLAPRCSRCGNRGQVDFLTAAGLAGPYTLHGPTVRPVDCLDGAALGRGRRSVSARCSSILTNLRLGPGAAARPRRVTNRWYTRTDQRIVLAKRVVPMARPRVLVARVATIRRVAGLSSV